VKYSNVHPLSRTLTSRREEAEARAEAERQRKERERREEDELSRRRTSKPSSTPTAMRTKISLPKGDKGERIKPIMSVTITRASLTGPQRNRPSPGKLTVNPFKQSPQEVKKKSSASSETAALAAGAGRDGFFGDLRKRYDKFKGKTAAESNGKKKASPSPSPPTPPRSRTSKKDEGNDEIREKKEVKGKCADDLSRENDKEAIQVGQTKGGNKKKTSKEEMQNYLLTHLLFDDVKEKPKSPKPGKKNEENAKMEVDEEGVYEPDVGPIELDPEYVKEMEKYLAFIEEDKVNNNKKSQKVKKNDIPKLKIVEVNNIKNKFERKEADPRLVPVSRSASNDLDATPVALDEKREKLKGFFEGKAADKRVELQPARPPRAARQISAFVNKFDCPEAAAKLKERKEKEREERRIMRLARLEEEQRLREIEEARRVEEERAEAMRLEQERLAEEERMRLLHEEQERQRLAYEKHLRQLKEKKERKKRMAKQEEERKLQQEKRLKGNKVLGRVQHIFEEDPQPTMTKRVGTLNADEIFAEMYESKDKDKQFKDASLAGIYMDRFKNKFEAKKGEEKRTLTRGVEKRKLKNPAALSFEIMEKLAKNEELLTPPENGSLNKKTDWSWKKKQPVELMDVTSNKVEEESVLGKRSEVPIVNEELLNEISELKSRFKDRDVEDEHKRKMEEYEKFMEEMNNFVHEPIVPKFENKVVKHKEVKKAVDPTLKFVKVNSILKDLTDGKDYEEDGVENVPKGNSKYVKELQNQLWKNQTLEVQPEKHQRDGGSMVSQIGTHLARRNEQFQRPSRSRVRKKIIHVPGVGAPQEHVKRNSTYEWKYKKKSIQELQQLLDDNKEKVPETLANKSKDVKDNMSMEAAEQGSNLQDDTIDDEDEAVNEYEHLMTEVDRYLSAPDADTTEVDFKSEIERIIDLIEEPKRDQSRDNIFCKPGKLNVAQIHASMLAKDDATNKEDEIVAKGHIKDLSEKLQEDLQRDAAKEEVRVATVGTDTIKNFLEKKTREENLPLLGKRTCTLKPTPAEVSPEDALKEMKAKGEAVKWKWKEKKPEELIFGNQAEETAKEDNRDIHCASENNSRHEVRLH